MIELLSIVYGVAAGLVWGTGDFAGGLATKRIDTTRTVLFAHSAGLIFLVLLSLVFGEPLSSPRDLLYGAVAGFMGMIGLLALYKALAENEMGITAPLAGVVTAVIPILVGFAKEGLPETHQLVGFCLGLVAVWFLAGGGNGAGIRWRELWLPVVAGIGFALFLVVIDRVSAGAIFWPLAAARAASVTILLFVILFRPQSTVKNNPGWRNSRLWLLLVLAGLFDAGGNAFIVLAAQTGRLDITSILSSMYPASTIFLAWYFLGERLTVTQRWGAALALAAVVVIAI